MNANFLAGPPPPKNGLRRAPAGLGEAARRRHSGANGHFPFFPLGETFLGAAKKLGVQNG